MTCALPDTARCDVVIVGGRCAGAATAMLLARAGLSVQVVERGRRGTDTLSTHALMRGAVVQLHRAVHERQADPAAVLFGRVVEIENPLELIGSNADARVFERDLQAFLQQRRRGDRESSAIRHRLQSVPSEVPEYLLHLRLIGRNEDRRRGKILFDDVPFGDVRAMSQ